MRCDSTARELRRIAPGEALARAWAADPAGTIFGNRFLGLPLPQNPLDLQIMQEVIWDTRPEVIVQCGAFVGAAPLLWASYQETFGIDGLVVSIGVEDRMEDARAHALWHRRVRFLHGSSVDPDIVAVVTGIAEGRRTMVILDSDHHEAHVRAEMDSYAPMVTSGCYMVVQHGFIEEVVPDHGPGPLPAIDSFLAEDDRFEVDRDRERLILTMCPSGFLRRV